MIKFNYSCVLFLCLHALVIGGFVKTFFIETMSVVKCQLRLFFKRILLPCPWRRSQGSGIVSACGSIGREIESGQGFILKNSTCIASAS
jgi:hypothetical protein